MPNDRVAENHLTESDHKARQELLASLERYESVAVVHRVRRASYRNEEWRELVAVVKQKRDHRKLILWWCQLGAPPEHHAGSSSFGTYETILNKLVSGAEWAPRKDWSASELRAIRSFIERDMRG